jgi:hypothetical protein
MMRFSSVPFSLHHGHGDNIPCAPYETTFKRNKINIASPTYHQFEENEFFCNQFALKKFPSAADELTMLNRSGAFYPSAYGNLNRSGIFQQVQFQPKHLQAAFNSAGSSTFNNSRSNFCTSPSSIHEIQTHLIILIYFAIS